MPHKQLHGQLLLLLGVELGERLLLLQLRHHLLQLQHKGLLLHVLSCQRLLMQKGLQLQFITAIHWGSRNCSCQQGAGQTGSSCNRHSCRLLLRYHSRGRRG